MDRPVTEERPDSTLKELPLKKIIYDAKVVGTQTEVKVEQRFGNTRPAGAKPIEVVYIFPLPAEASVLGVEMKIGARIVIAELRERGQAHREYERARDAGHYAALMEQKRENIFTMSVGGIEPGEEIGAVVRYIAPVDWQDGGGRYTMPLVVAPRFIHGGPEKSPDTSRITPQVVTEVSYDAAMVVELKPGFAARVESPSHPDMIAPFDLGADETKVLNLVGVKPDRDFILTYKTAAELPTVKADLTIFTPDDGSPFEEFVLLQLTPGEMATRVTTPLDVVIVLDKSGSMDGAPVKGLKRVTGKLLDRYLRAGRPVRVGVITYDKHIHAQLALSPIGDEQRQVIKDIPTKGGGSTETPMALDAAMKMFGKEDDGRERSVVLVTDAMVDTRYKSKRGARIHVVGIGTAINDAEAKRWSRETGGSVYFTRPDEDLDLAATSIAALTSGPVVLDVALRGLPEDVDVVGIDDLYANQPRTIAIKLPRQIAGFTVTGKGADGKLLEWPVTVPPEETTELASKLWAKAKIRETDDPKQQIQLSLCHGIVCAQTAFVAVSLKEKPGEKPERVDIPVLLPEGWSMDAVSAGVPSLGACRRLASGPTLQFRSAGLTGLSLGRGFEGGEEHFDADEAGENEAESVLLEAALKVFQTPKGPPLVIKAEEFLDTLKTNGRSEATDKVWQEIQVELTAATTQQFNGWSEETKARLFLALVLIAKHGYDASPLPEGLVAEPKNPIARQYWLMARKNQEPTV